MGSTRRRCTGRKFRPVGPQSPNTCFHSRPNGSHIVLFLPLVHHSFAVGTKKISIGSHRARPLSLPLTAWSSPTVMDVTFTPPPWVTEPLAAVPQHGLSTPCCYKNSSHCPLQVPLMLVLATSPTKSPCSTGTHGCNIAEAVATLLSMVVAPVWKGCSSARIWM